MRNLWDKQDNGDLRAKLGLRRYFLAKYHTDDLPDVFDACQGTRVLWSNLEREFELAGYWGVDQKKQKGRLKIDSARVLALPGWKWNVIDVDVYGVPWRHWLAILENATRPLTVFLTLGRAGFSGSKLSREEVAALGLGTIQKRIGGSQYLGIFGRVLGEVVVPILLARGNCGRMRIVEALGATSRTSNAQYFGLRLSTQAIDAEDVVAYNDMQRAGESESPAPTHPTEKGG